MNPYPRLLPIALDILAPSTRTVARNMVTTDSPSEPDYQLKCNELKPLIVIYSKLLKNRRFPRIIAHRYGLVLDFPGQTNTIFTHMA